MDINVLAGHLTGRLSAELASSNPCSTMSLESKWRKLPLELETTRNHSLS
jgi:hypothetical protein